MKNLFCKAFVFNLLIFIALIQLCAQEVTTRSGTIRGVMEEDVLVFKGVPFAAAPVGDLRWKAPAPPLPWQGIRPADQFSCICMQNGMYPEDSPSEEMSEDCLYLNIWKPLAAGRGKLPVMLWLYGGGLKNGSASSPYYDGSSLARRGVIVITANYRLGAFGFLAHPGLSQETDYQGSGNYGLWDMIAALRWIQDNIVFFGGDPANVTVFGQSSGATAISALMASPQAAGLFHKAIGQSGGLFEPIELDAGASLAGAEEAGERFALRAGAQSLAALRNIPAKAILEVPFDPSIIVDGCLVRQPPYDAFKKGEYNKLPVLTGYTTDEGREFAQDLNIGKETYQDELSKHFPGWSVRLTAPDPGKTDEEAVKAAIAFEGDIRFKWNVWTWAKLASKENRVYVYQFDHSPPFPAGSEKAAWGPAHGSDLFYVFGNLDQHDWNWTADDRELSAAILGYWTNFAKYGDPNGPGLPHWPPFSEKTRDLLYLGLEIKNTPFPVSGSMLKIDRVYSTARWIVNNFLILFISALGLLFLAAVLIIKRIRRHRQGNSADLSGLQR